MLLNDKGPESLKVKALASAQNINPMAFLSKSTKSARNLRKIVEVRLLQMRLSAFRFRKARGIKQPFFQAAGNRNYSNGSLNNVGANGNYWSSTVNGTNAWNLNFNSSDSNMNTNNRATGFSVRCLQDWYPPISFKLSIL